MNSGSRNLFRLTRFILLKVPVVFKFLSGFRKSQPRVLVIKTDAIGDYVLFRNYLEVIANAGEFKGYRFTLLGNELWKDLALEYDNTFVNNFIFINADSLYQSPWKTWRLGWQLFKNNYAVVLQPSYTRLLVTDGLAALTVAKQIIGFNGDNEGISPRYKLKTDKFYTRLIDLPATIKFEFYRSAFFFESILGRPFFLPSPSLGSFRKNAKHVVIAPGAGNSKRSWQKENFLQLVQLILEHDPTYVISIVGGKSEVDDGDYLAGNLPAQNVDNLTGKTSLKQLVGIIGEAGLVITNETGTAHIATAVQTPAVCILGGGHFGRFAPYPENMVDRPVCIYEKMPCYNCNWICEFETSDAAPFPCISQISVRQVWETVLKMLPWQ